MVNNAYTEAALSPLREADAGKVKVWVVDRDAG